VVVLVLLFSAGAALILRAEDQQRDALASRFDSRQATAVNFIAAYVAEVFEREKVLSARSFAGPVITRQFAKAASDQGYAAAVLLDARGRMLASQPDNPSATKRDLTTLYTHLRSAVAGKSAVSGVVPSAVRGLPVVGFAVPFETSTGKRVFSGAYPVGDTPVALFVRNAVPFHTANIVVVDAAGVIVASNEPTAAGRPLSEANPQLSPIGAATAYLGSGPEHRYLTQSGIPGTPWRLIFTVTTDELFAPLEGAAIWIPWLALVAFFVASLLALAIFYPFLTQRARLVESDARRRAILDTAEDGFIGMDEGGRITEWNTAATRLLGWGFTEAIGKPLADLIIPPVHRQAHRDGLLHFLTTGHQLLPPGPMQVQALCRDGTFLDLEFTLSRLHWERGWHFHAFLRDISERLELEAELRKFALTDALTGLANRRAALERLDQAVARAQRRHNPIAVLFIDVDKFKAVNDTHGHAAGDAVLVSLTARLHAMFRTEDTVARLGGDEFLVICEDLAGHEAARELAERTRTTLAEPYPVAGHHLHISASVGLALSDGNSTAEGLLNHADTEMYTAKAARRTFDEITNPPSRHR
jgi:diguanylate cyclase (GGDEF)-like protein/PAS domain S-box-containing protein